MGNDYDDALKTIAKGAGIAFVGLMLNRFLAFLSKIIIARSLSSTEYGILNLGLAVFSVLVIISLAGVLDGVARYIPYYRSVGDNSRVRGTLYSSIKITLSISVIMSTIIFISATELSEKIFDSEELSDILRIFSIAIPFWVSTRVFTSASIGFKRVDISVAIEALHQIVRIVSIVALLLLGFGIVGVAFGYLLAFVISPFAGYYLLRKVLPSREHKTKAIDRELLSYSWPLLLASFSIVILSWTDTLMLGYFTTEDWVGVYNASINAAEILAIIGATVGSLLLPIITEFYSNGNFTSIRKMYKIVTKWIFGLSFPLLLLYFLFSNYILEILYGLEYTPGSVVLPVLVFGYFIRRLFLPSDYIIRSVGKTKFIMTVSWITAFINILLNAILIPLYGIAGAAASTTFSSVLFSLANLGYSYKLIGILPFSKRVISSVLAGIVSVAVVHCIATLPISDLTVLNIAACLFIYIILYFTLLLVFRYFESEDAIIFKAVEARLGIKMQILRKLVLKFI